jgi:hypothetical protein
MYVESDRKNDHYFLVKYSLGLCPLGALEYLSPGVAKNHRSFYCKNRKIEDFYNYFTKMTSIFTK